MKKIEKSKSINKKNYNEESWLTDLKEIKDLANNDDSFISQDLFSVNKIDDKLNLKNVESRYKNYFSQKNLEVMGGKFKISEILGKRNVNNVLPPFK